MNSFDASLRSVSMGAAESAKKAALLAKLLETLKELRRGNTESASEFFVPGRIEFLGKHTDYAGGRSITCAIERGICLAAAPRADSQMHIVDVGRQSEVRFMLNGDQPFSRDDWPKYAVTVARRLVRDFPSAHTGADIAFASDLPRASGMSSSSALIIAVFFAIADANSVWKNDAYRQCIRSREDLAGYLSAVESGADFGSFASGCGVGTFGGSEDHVAILCSRTGFLRHYSYCPIRLEREVALPENYTFVIGVSGVKADKTGNARESYNHISIATRTILDAWRRATGREDFTLASALASSPDAAERLQNVIRGAADFNTSSQFLLNRLAQFAEESNEIVPAAADALSSGDIGTLGLLVGRSQSMAESQLGNQTSETIELARSARALGAAAASSFGAGFGGSVWALVHSSRAEEFREAWAASYHQAFPERAPSSEFLITGAGPGVVQFQD
ncbi:MAG TPA: galactokinase family protein [Candidatus Acidoferrales bacterium]|nr:galactokinase family protein [Candidatus Acidoferrales bacterium]